MGIRESSIEVGGEMGRIWIGREDLGNPSIVKTIHNRKDGNESHVSGQMRALV